MNRKKLNEVIAAVETELVAEYGSVKDTCTEAGAIFHGLLGDRESEGGKVADVVRFVSADGEHEWVEVDELRVDLQEEEYEGDYDEGSETDFPALFYPESECVEKIVHKVAMRLAAVYLSE